MKKTFVWSLATIGWIWSQTNDSFMGPALPYPELKKIESIHFSEIDKKKTTANVLILSALTILPLLGLISLETHPEFRTEIHVSMAALSIPSLVGWPLFIRDYVKYKKARKKKAPYLHLEPK